MQILKSLSNIIKDIKYKENFNCMKTVKVPVNSEIIYDKSIVPSFDRMIKPLIQALDTLGGTAGVEELDKKLIEIMDISKEASNIPHGHPTGRTEVSYRAAWARTYLKKFGLIKNPVRGTWSFTNNFNGDYNNIDSDSIVRAVKQKEIAPFSDPNLSNIESHIAFEKFVLGVLDSYSKALNKSLMIPSSVDRTIYDAYFPDGIDDSNIPTYVIIKYSNVNKSSYFRMVENEGIRLSRVKEIELAKKKQFLFILGAELGVESKEGMRKMTESRSKTKVVIWDYNDLFERADIESDYMNFLENPKKALVEEAISARQTFEQQERERKKLIEQLKEAYLHEEITLFLGAGVSIDAGVPLWKDLINQLLIQMIIKKSTSKKLKKEEQSKLTQLAYNNKEESPITQMRYIRTAFDSEEYFKLVHNVLYADKPRINTELLNTLVDISTPRRNHIGVKGIVTYNFDDLLERRLKSKGIDFNIVFRESDIPDIDSLNIYHAHGFLPHKLDGIIDNDINLIFSEEDYHKVYRDAYCWSNITQLNAFRDSTCLFVGCSLTDPNLRRLLDVAARHGENPRHYALLQRKSLGVAKEEDKIDNELLELYEGIDNNIRESYF